MSLVRAENLTKIYRMGEIEVEAIKSVSFEIEPASFISFIGPSGSGKTTGAFNPPHSIPKISKAMIAVE